MNKREIVKKSTPKSKLPEEEFILNLIKTQDILFGRLIQVLKRYGLTSPVQYNILRILRGAGADGLPSQTIGRRLLTRVPDVTRLIDCMERHGLVERMRSHNDRRIVLIKLTAKGTELVNALDQPVTEAHIQNLRHLTPDEIKAGNLLLIKVRGEESEVS